MAHILGTNENDRLQGNRGDDLIEGLDGDDLISERSGENTIDGGAGNDRIVGGRDADIIDGGSGSDHVWGRNGDDLLIYNLSENIESSDYYDGGYHSDTLRLVLTQEQAAEPVIQDDIARFEQFLLGNGNPDTAGGPVFQFTAFDLTVRNIEELQVEIIDSPDLPSFSIDDPAVTEGDPGDDTTISFTVTRSGDNGTASTVAYAVSPNTATTPDDYTALDALSGTLTFAAGETEKTIILDITEDDIPEAVESFTVELSTPTNATISKGVGIGTIEDDDAPSLSIDDPTVTEGDPGDDTTISFTVTRSGDNGAASTVAYSVLPNTATTPDDYTALDPLTGTLTFAAGESSKTITLDITEDDIPEGTESFTVELSAPINATINKAIGAGTIEDDDVPSLSIDDPTVTEGDPGDDTTISFTVTRSGDNGAASTVAYAVAPGSATTPDDYSALDPLTGTLTFAAGETEKTITLDITEDDIPEGTESFTVELSGPTNAVISKAIGTGTIADDDVPSLSIDDPTVTEGDPGDDTTISFTVTRSGDNGVASTVAYAVSPNTATTPEDYDALDPLTGTLTFAAGESSKTITLDITEDDIQEAVESFTVELSAPTNAVISKGVGIGTIEDDDAPSLSIDDPAVTEGDPGDDTTITFTVSRSGDNDAASTVAYAVLPNTATTPDDYTALDPLTGTLTFAVGEVSKTITLDITEDDIPEGTESFTVELSGATNATISKAVGTGTIADDDVGPVVPRVSINNITIAEEGETADQFTLSLSEASTEDITVRWSLGDISATLGSDYTGPTSGEVTIAAGALEAQLDPILFQAIDDPVALEGNETFGVALTSVSGGGAVIGDGSGVGTIIDNDTIDTGGLSCGYTWGDPHYVTFDGLSYDMQGVGEFILVENTSGDDVMVQTRTVAYGRNLSINTAVATSVDGHRVTYNTLDSDPLRVDGAVVHIDPEDGPYAVGSGQIIKSGSTHTIVYPNEELLIVYDFGSMLNIRFCASDDREEGSLQGLLGNFDGNYSNDLALSDGTTFSTSISFYDLYRVYAEDWRITQDQSLFDYGPGEDTETYTDRDHPRVRMTYDLLSQEDIDAADALIPDECIVDPAIREAAILDYVMTGDISYLEAACMAPDPDAVAEIIDPLIIWKNGGSVVIGTETTPAVFNIGTDSAAPTGTLWSGGGTNDNWSDPDNWSTGTPPAGSDTVLFTDVDAGNVNIVDGDRGIAALHYNGAGDQTTNLNGGSILSVEGDVGIGVANSQQRVTFAVIDGTTVTAHLDEMNVGIVADGSGSAEGNLYVGDSAVIDASNTGSLSIGRETGAWNSRTASANGSLTLGSNSVITLGTVDTAATLNIGWSQNTNRYGSGNATGVLDVTEGSLIAELSALRIGQTSNRSSATGEFIAGDGVTMEATTVNIGIGTNAAGTLTFTDGFSGSFSADTVNMGGGLFDFGNNILTIDSVGNIQATTFNLSGGTLQGDTVNYDDVTGTFNFTGGTLAVDTFNGTLDQQGGVLSPGDSPGITTVNGDYGMASGAGLQIELNGSAGVDFDQLQVNGEIDLNSDGGTGGLLDVLFGYTPTVGEGFVIIENDGSDAIADTFDGLADEGTFDVEFDTDTITLEIDYQGGDGNDVELTVAAVTASAAVAGASAADWLTGGAGDESLLFESMGPTDNLDLNPESPLGLALLGSTATSDVVVDADGVTESWYPDPLPETDGDGQLIGQSLDSFGYLDGNV